MRELLFAVGGTCCASMRYSFPQVYATSFRLILVCPLLLGSLCSLQSSLCLLCVVANSEHNRHYGLLYENRELNGITFVMSDRRHCLQNFGFFQVHIECTNAIVTTHLSSPPERLDGFQWLFTDVPVACIERLVPSSSTSSSETQRNDVERALHIERGVAL